MNELRAAIDAAEWTRALELALEQWRRPALQRIVFEARLMNVHAIRQLPLVVVIGD